MRRYLRRAAGLLLLLGASCSPAPQAPARPAADRAPQDGGWIVAAHPTDPTTWNWVLASDSPTLQVGRLLADSLVGIGLDLEYVPRLARSWTFSQGGRVLTFRLHDDVRWHDAEPLTAADVVFTYDMAVAPGTGAARFSESYFADVEAVEAPDPRTVRVTYRRPFAPALSGWESLLILPRHRWEGRDPRQGPEDGRPVGSGPFKLLEWKAAREIVLEANDDYFGGRPHLDRLTLQLVRNRKTAFAALRTGEIDLTSSVLAGDWPTATELAGRGELQVAHFGAQRVSFIVWNGDGSNRFFTDARVRRAMTHAVDREGFLATVLEGMGLVATSTFVPGTFAHDPSSRPLPHDLEAAARLLDQAGWIDADGDGVREKDGADFRFALTVVGRNATGLQLAELLQDALRSVGVVLTVEPVEGAQFSERIKTGAFQAQLSSWRLDVDPDPFDFWHSSQWPHGFNYAAYADEEVDRLCQQGREEMDPQRRAALYARVQAILHRDQPFTFLFHPEHLIAFAPRLRGIQPARVGIWRPYPSASTWWVPSELRRRGRTPAGG